MLITQVLLVLSKTLPIEPCLFCSGVSIQGSVVSAEDADVDRRPRLNYTSVMTIERITQLHAARPFQPFRIHMADGRHIDVQHPEFLAHGRAGRTLVVHTGADDFFEIVDLLLVTSLELLDGRSRRARPTR